MTKSDMGFLKEQAARDLERMFHQRGLSRDQACIQDFTTENVWLCMHLQGRDGGSFTHVHYYPRWCHNLNPTVVGYQLPVGWHTDKYAFSTFEDDVDPEIQTAVNDCLQNLELQYRLEGKWE